jgi:hypothetical protein
MLKAEERMELAVLRKHGTSIRERRGGDEAFAGEAVLTAAMLDRSR